MSVGTSPTDRAAITAGAEGPALSARGIHKAFGQVEALRGVSIEAHRGQVTALVGDNGAGKSTLVKIVSGIHQPDSGRLEMGGTEVSFKSPMDALAAGIATVFQDLALVEMLDVATNMYLGSLPVRGPFVDDRRLHADAADVLQEMRIGIPSVRAPVGTLSGGQRQAVAVARAVIRGSKIIIMDEPTAALGVRETAQVLDVVRGLREQGRAVIIISHDLDTVFRAADVLHVLRLGRSVATRRTDETSRDELVGLITGLISSEDSAA